MNKTEREGNMLKLERNLRNRIKILQIELENVRKDRDKFRKAFSEDFRWLLKLLGENKYPTMASYIETKAKSLRYFEWWYW